MTIKTVDVSIKLPSALWNQFLYQARLKKENETSLLTRAITQFLEEEKTKASLAERLGQECDELAKLTFDDIGTEDEWLFLQNEALNLSEIDFS
jgi:hypothetical protein